jgi:Copper type II ascorbate-dependent monooxygenase, C-terminal domain/Copper type II ascorbate-dependent monooxygenase, N-terminal domain
MRLAPLALLALAACSGAAPTWYADAQPIVAARCAGCHYAGGIAPTSLQTYQEAFSQRQALRAQLASGTMPPWPPAAGCNTYLQDRSLPAAEKATLLAWLDGGATAGSPADAPKAATSTPAGLSRVDATLGLAAPYTPVLSPDEYRCFVLDWPEARARYVTGFAARPGNAALVHHVIAYLATPDQAAAYQALDNGDSAPGYTCFGGSGGPSQQMLGAWAPGSGGYDFPAGSGIAVQPGSKVILQIHYNTSVHLGQSDQSTIQVKLDDTVDRVAAVLPWTDPNWLRGLMPIPAGQADVMHWFAFDPTPFLSLITQGVIPNGPVRIWSAALHQHLRGKSSRLEIKRASGAAECLLQIDAWDFHWQGSYGLAEPVTLNPGDQLSLTCHWDNSAANQPVVDGVQVAPKDLNWGEGTGDEMCIGFLYVTR